MRNLTVTLIMFLYLTWCQGDYYDYYDNYRDLVKKETFDWCCLKCDGPHVMCPDALNKLKLSEPRGCSSRVKNGTAVLLGNFSEETLVELINRERNKFAKNADVSNMRYLQISLQLKKLAQRLAGYCNSIPSACVDTDLYKVKAITFNVSNDKNVTMSMVLNYWKRGRIAYLKQYHNQLYSNNETSNKTNDYTLLMWSTTSEIGCAQAFYHGNTNSSYQITCLLGPGGNIIGKPVWERGAPCSNCSTPEDWTRQKGFCKDALCYAQFPQWPRDDERLAACKSEEFPPAQDMIDYGARGFLRDEKPYAKGIKVILKPRYICDPISAADNLKSTRWHVLSVSALFLRKLQ